MAVAAAVHQWHQQNAKHPCFDDSFGTILSTLYFGVRPSFYDEISCMECMELALAKRLSCAGLHFFCIHFLSYKWRKKIARGKFQMVPQEFLESLRVRVVYSLRPANPTVDRWAE